MISASLPPASLHAGLSLGGCDLSDVKCPTLCADCVCVCLCFRTDPIHHLLNSLTSVTLDHSMSPALPCLS